MSKFDIDNNGSIKTFTYDSMFHNSMSIKSQSHIYNVHFTDKFHPTITDELYIIDKNVYELYPQYKNIKNKLIINATEKNKSIESVLKIYDKLNSLKYNKSKRLIVIGGGIIQDISAFAAKTYKRGIEWVYIPTTLLSMADSCIGSKCAVNYKSIKNQIGCYSTPSFIYINTAFLETLDITQTLSGVSEILKLSIIGNSVELFKKYFDSPNRDFKQLIYLALSIKKTLIEYDEFDNNYRLALNYGHTFGHSIESKYKNKIPHGIAVMYGMDIINKLTDCKLDIRKYFNMITNYHPIEIDKTKHLEIIKQDKKSMGDTIKIVYYDMMNKKIVIKPIKIIQLTGTIIK